MSVRGVLEGEGAGRFCITMERPVFKGEGLRLVENIRRDGLGKTRFVSSLREFCRDDAYFWAM